MTAVVLTGAGVSAESGVPTFRGNDGLWSQFSPEELASVDAFLANPDLVLRWYAWRRELIAKVLPNPAHHALVALENFFSRFTLVTQNVDGLHQAAGSKNVLELHGNIFRNKCHRCGEQCSTQTDDTIHFCRCGGAIRPDVVWFGEMLPEKTFEIAVRHTRKADIFLVIGTSGLVYPAASLPSLARESGALLVEINPEKTDISRSADYYLQGKAGELLPTLVRCLQQGVFTEFTSKT